MSHKMRYGEPFNTSSQKITWSLNNIRVVIAVSSFRKPAGGTRLKYHLIEINQCARIWNELAETLESDKKVKLVEIDFQAGPAAQSETRRF